MNDILKASEHMATEYIEERSGGLYVAGTRVSLASVVLEFKEGATPETILQDFPALTSLENVYGSITYYLANQAKVDEYLIAQKQHWEQFRSSADSVPESLISRLQGIRR
ncbi:MAG: DUF433 domain-containing protein [Acidobacteriia bacterium]|nr:DUF433 domain-containing protein [Terriglobia bacterium]